MLGLGSGSRTPWAATFFAALCVALFIGAWQSQLAAPAGPPKTAFDTARAQAALEAILSGIGPHPAGSDANATVRDRVMAELRSAGYEPEIQTAFACSKGKRRTSCGTAQNIVAIRKGTATTGAILATAHYDSVAAGPGAGDDMAGTVAMLALARHLASQPPMRNDVIFLISDAEEDGLLGAIAFAEKHPLFASVRAIVNLEARGASGPSTMFETGPGNLELIRLFQSAVHRPVADSVAYEVYKLLPNDTDFSIYRRTDLTGFNFAFTGSAARYHSPADRPGLLDRRSLQHHGDNVFALVPALGQADLKSLRSQHDASYFDLFGQALVVWPSAWNLWIAGAGLGGLLLLIVQRRAQFGALSLLWAFALAFAAPVSLFAMGWALAFPLGVWPQAHPLDHANPLAGTVALAAGLLLAPAMLSWLAASPDENRRPSAEAVALTAWAFAAAAAVAVALYLPGATHAFAGPVLAFALVGMVETSLRPGRGLTLATVAGFAVAAFFWMSYFVALQVVFGFANAESRLAAMAVFGWAALALFATVFAGAKPAPAIGAMALVTAAAAVLGFLAAPYSPEHPRGMNVGYVQEEGGPAHWLLTGSGGPLDQAYIKAQGFAAGDAGARALGLVWGPAATKPAQPLNLPGPFWQETGRETPIDGWITISGTLQAGRDGRFVGLSAPPEAKLIKVVANGEIAMERKPDEALASARVRIVAQRSRPIAVSLTLADGTGAPLTFFEVGALPATPEAAALQAARGQDTSPVDAGDAALVLKTVRP
jgi:hypothetical protein